MSGQEQRPTAMVVAPETAGALGIITDELVRSAGEQAVKLRELQDALLGAVRPGGVTRMGDKPYFEDATIQTWRLLVGIEFPEERYETEEVSDSKGKFTRFICHKKAVWGGKTFATIGTSSTRDKFFAEVGGQPRHEDDIDQNNLRKKASTNAEHRLVMKLLGMGAIEWEDLKKHGFRPDDRRTVSYGSKAQQAASGAGKMSPRKIELLGRIENLCDGDRDAASNAIATLTSNRKTGFSGYRTMKAVPDDLLDRIEAGVKAGEEKRRQAAEEEPEPPPGEAFGEQGEREPGEEG